MSIKHSKMYGGIDKYSGDIAFKRNSNEVNPLEVMSESNCFETIVAEDASGKEVFLGASLDIYSGELTWNQIDSKDKTLKNVMGMSQMSSMLKDKQRNEVYNEAITKCIHDFIAKYNRKPYVLDIGCGTGLLSMQAARAGAEKVYGCEMFASWCEAAKENVKENGLEGVVKIINKHSSALQVKSGNQHDFDLDRKCDILVSEILDTALLGEGVLVAVRDAKKRLLVDNPIIIPEKADVFVELIHSTELRRLTSIEGNKINSILMKIDSNTTPCKYTTLLPIHYEYLRNNQSSVFIKSCSAVELLTTVDLTDGMNRRFTIKTIPCSSSPNGLIFSWKVFLYDNQYTYSTIASDWNADNWQDHWMQGYYTLTDLSLNGKGDVTLYSLMSDSNWKFDISLDANSSDIKREMIAPLQCKCGFHHMLSPGLFGQYNDPHRNKKIQRMIQNICSLYEKGSIAGPALVLGDDSFIGMQLYSALQKSALKVKPLVYSFENKEGSLMLWKRIIEYNQNDTIMVSTTCNNPDISSIMQPSEIGSVFWNFHHYQMEDHCVMEALSYWCMVNAVREYCNPMAWICPSFVNIMAMVIELGPLYDSFGEVEQVNGFKHSAFNRNISEWFTNLYPFPLYMYEYKELSKAQAIMTLDFSQSLYCTAVEAALPVSDQGKANCVVVWCEYYCGDKNQFEDIDENWQTPYQNGHFVPYKKQLLQFRKEGVSVKEGDVIALQVELNEHFEFHLSFIN